MANEAEATNKLSRELANRPYQVIFYVTYAEGHTRQQNPNFVVYNLGRGTVIGIKISAEVGAWKDEYRPSRILRGKDQLPYVLYQRPGWDGENPPKGRIIIDVDGRNAVLDTYHSFHREFS